MALGRLDISTSLDMLSGVVPEAPILVPLFARQRLPFFFKKTKKIIQSKIGLFASTASLARSLGKDDRHQLFYNIFAAGK
jgi:hypothetical protein